MRTPQLADNLRRAVLQAAIEGKLNDRTNENARDLLAAIQTEKAAQQKTGKQKKNKPLAAIKEEEIPFAIPENWVWVRLGEIGQIVSGGTPKTTDSECWNDGDIPWITPADMRNLLSKYIEKGARNITRKGLQSSSAQLLPKGSILFSSRAPIGYVAIAKNEITTNQGFKSVVPFKTAMSEYLYFVLLALKPEIEKLGTGTTFKEVSGTVVSNVAIPLPPLTEQQQIVAKLNQLLSEIDNLKTQEQALLAAQNAFPKKLRAAILQAAIQGELNERTDENARDLLAAIQTEKAALQRTGKLKKDKPLAAIDEEEIPFTIPENWVWVRLGEIGQIFGGGTPKTTHSEYWDNGDIPWITPADMRNLTSKYIERGARNITKVGLNSSSAQLLPKNSILFSSRAPIGYVAIAQNEMATNQGFKSVAPFKTEMSEYLYFVLLALKPEIEKLGTGTTFKEVSGTVVGNVAIPLPPLTEQQQIVAKLEALLAEIDTLENAT